MFLFSVTLSFYGHLVSAIFQFEASSLTDSLPSVTDEGGLQDIENFSIFKGLNGMCYFGMLSVVFSCELVVENFYSHSVLGKLVDYEFV